MQIGYRTRYSVRFFFPFFSLSVFSGLIGSLTFAPYTLWPAGLASLLILFWVLARCQWRWGSIYLCSFWCSFFISGMFWVHVGLSKFGGIGIEKSILATCFIAFCYALFLITPWFLCFKSKPNSLHRICLLPVIWLLCEWSRYWFLGGLTWLLMGYGHQTSWLSGWIPIFGVLGAGFFIAITASLALIVICNINRSLKTVGVAGLVLSVIWLSGAALKGIDWTKSKDAHVPVAIIQPSTLKNVTSSSDLTERRSIWTNRMEEMSEPYWNSGLLIWPEGGISKWPDELDEYVKKLHAKAKSNDTAFVGGGMYSTAEQGSSEEDLVYNSIYGLGEAQGLYHKVKMAPLGEYSPILIDALFSRVSEYPDSFKFIIQDPIQFQFEEQQYLIASNVCYEIAFGANVRKNASNANIIVNLSDDSWFDGTYQLDQSLQIAQIRALENQKPLLRAAKGGISAHINYKGDIVKQAQSEISTILRSEITPREGQTPYSRWGDIPILIIGFILLLATFLFPRKLR